MQKTKPKKIFGVLILTNRRAGKCKTERSLREQGYTGPIVYMVDTEDPQIEEYRKIYGTANVVVFDKEDVAPFDAGDNFDGRRGVVYARNHSFEIARKLRWTHFAMLDDDYTRWGWTFDSARNYVGCVPIKNLDPVFDLHIRFLDRSGAITVAFVQGGDLFGGATPGNGKTGSSINLGANGKRKAMNTFICRADRPIRFVGRVNEDVNAYVLWGATGELFFTNNVVRVYQAQTQANAGGMTPLYLDNGTYVKSFYSVMYAPSFVKISVMGWQVSRLHHRVNWGHAIPKIVRESVRRF